MRVQNQAVTHLMMLSMPCESAQGEARGVGPPCTDPNHHYFIASVCIVHGDETAIVHHCEVLGQGLEVVGNADEKGTHHYGHFPQSIGQGA